MNVDELLAKAKKPSADAMRLHPFYRGKIETAVKCTVHSFNDFSVWYTPGVAAPCKAIQANPELVYEYTNKWNTVAVISDGTRVLGLGDIGPKAGLPVMEGKSLLYKYLGGVDGFPIMLNTKDPDAIINTALMLQPGLGGVNLEDISSPKCFYILDTLREKSEIPMWHDDQQGTATVTLSGLMNALKVVGKNKGDVKIAFIGAGASNIAAHVLSLNGELILPNVTWWISTAYSERIAKIMKCVKPNSKMRGSIATSRMKTDAKAESLKLSKAQMWLFVFRNQAPA